ncbi:MAG: asparaginase domain-containing protein [Pseudomonadota bacterium]
MDQLDLPSGRGLLLLTTGGTIDKVYFDASSEFEVGDSVLPELLREAQVNLAYRLHALLRKDSLELTDTDRNAIRAAVAAAPETRCVITHGTDTMTATAATLAGLPKTIVLTGSLAPARFARTDATFNVGMAFAAAQCLPAGVYVAMNGQVFAAARVRKDPVRKRFVAT